jgi:hypothetical protein
MVERQQNLRHATRQKLADNYTLSGGRIEAGLNVMESPNICGGCGSEMAPYQDGKCC